MEDGTHEVRGSGSDEMLRSGMLQVGVWMFPTTKTTQERKMKRAWSMMEMMGQSSRRSVRQKLQFQLL
eukprot:1375184-Ditylum_brightwellii.AAC.1